jgi:predicted Zn finger-like uncharacterized protein
MHIHCERCQSEFDLDDSQVGGGRVEVQCSVCAHVFWVEQPGSNETGHGALSASPSPDNWLGDRTEGNARGPIHKSRGALKFLVGLTVAGAVASVGILWQEGRIHLAGVPKASGEAAGPAQGPNRIAADRKRNPGAEAIALGQAPPAPDSQPMPEVAPTTPRPSTRPVVEALPSPRAAEPAQEPEKAAPSAPSAHSESYDKLVADGDRLLQSGSSVKAKDLYQKALRARPSGWKALCGLGFATLRLGQIPVAYEYFKRALSAKPAYPPALFGLAEIHRARGERTLALQSYKHYLQITPNGKEAEAARRQIETLQASR